MRGAVAAAGAALWIVCCSLAGMGISLCSYRSPSTSIADAQMTFAYRYYDDAATPSIDVNAGSLAVDAARLVDRPSSGYTLSGVMTMALADFVPTAWQGQASAAYRIYPWSDGPIFLFAGTEGVAASGMMRPSLDVRAGLGAGRLTDVRPLAQAMHVHEKLLDLGVLRVPLSDDALRVLAERIAATEETASSQERVAELASWIEREGGVPLDAAAALAVDEVLRARSSERWCGWMASVGVGYEMLDPLGAPQDPIVAFSFDAALAASPRDQWLLRVGVSGPFSLFRDNVLTARASYAMDLGGASVLSAEIDVLRLQAASVLAFATYSARLGLEFRLHSGAVGVHVSVSRSSGDPGWSMDVSAAASIRLF